MTNELDLLDAESVGFEAMDLVKALPGILQQTGQAVDKQKADAKKTGDSKKEEGRPASTPDKTPAPGIGLGWKIGGGVAAVLILRRILKG